MKCTTEQISFARVVSQPAALLAVVEVTHLSLLPLGVFAQVAVDVLPRMCAPVMVELEGETDPLLIAMKELK